MKLFITLSLLISFTYVNAQHNLVPNPSFEDTLFCPNSGGQVSNARYWETVVNTPDYFHVCNPFWQFSVPYNTWGYQWPNSGEAYMGLADYINTPGSPSDSVYREVIGTNLISPLIVGNKYFVNFKACLSFNPFYYNWAANNKLGILFSTFNYLLNASTQINYCQIYTDNILKDSINWTTIRGSFIADSAYTYISIGNFFMNYLTDTIHLLNSSNNAYAAYYYIDDVCVSTDSIFSEIWTSYSEDIYNENYLLFPIPAINQIYIRNISLGCKQIELYDLHGILIKKYCVNHNKNLTLDISSFSDGVYSIVFRKDDSIQSRKFIKSK
jgi:hypothetical protein